MNANDVVAVLCLCEVLRERDHADLEIGDDSNTRVGVVAQEDLDQTDNAGRNDQLDTLRRLEEVENVRLRNK